MTSSADARYVALSGGVGGAKLALGLCDVLADPGRLIVVANTGDDFEHLGLKVCPDLDTLTYTLAGLANEETGWGRAGESGAFMEALGALGGETWFFLGDKDLAIHVERTRRLRTGESLSAITSDLCARLGVPARIVPMSGRQTLDTYCVLESDGSRIEENGRLREIRRRLPKALTASDDRPLKVHRRAPRQVRMFSTAVQVSVSQDPVNNRTVLELVAADRPGLLLQVGKIFEEQRVALHNAKIATLGERAEDVFFVTTLNYRRLDESRCNRLVEAIESTLSSPAN